MVGGRKGLCVIENRFPSLRDVVLDEQFPDVDIALRRGRHVDREDVAWYSLLIDGQEHLEPFYRRFGYELVHVSEGYFYLLPTGERLGRRHLSLPEMLVGQTLALLYLDPASMQQGGVVTRVQALSHLASVLGGDALTRPEPRRKRMDERAAEEQVRQKFSEALRRLAGLGFVDLLEEDGLKLRSALLRFAEPVRGQGSRRAHSGSSLLAKTVLGGGDSEEEPEPRESVAAPANTTSRCQRACSRSSRSSATWARSWSVKRRGRGLMRAQAQALLWSSGRLLRTLPARPSRDAPRRRERLRQDHGHDRGVRRAATRYLAPAFRQPGRKRRHRRRPRHLGPPRRGRATLVRGARDRAPERRANAGGGSPGAEDRDHRGAVTLPRQWPDPRSACGICCSSATATTTWCRSSRSSSETPTSSAWPAVEVFASTKDYLAFLFELGVIPLRLGTDDERNKLQRDAAHQHDGRHLSRADQRAAVLPAQGRERAWVTRRARMRANLDACHLTRIEVSGSAPAGARIDRHLRRAA